MFDRFIFSGPFIALLLCMVVTQTLGAAPLAGRPQDLIYHNDEGADEAGSDDTMAQDSGLETQSAPPVLSTVPASPVPQLPVPQLPVPQLPVPQLPVPSGREPVVERNELAAPVLTNYGILDEKNGSMPMDIWKGISYGEATASLQGATQMVNGGTAHSVLQTVLRTAALSKTYEPSGRPEDAQAFFNARIMAVQAAGDREGALALLKSRADGFKAADWQAFIEQDIRQRHVAQACALAAEKLTDGLSAFAQKLGILCDIKDAKLDAARLHLDVLREAGDGDAVFLDLAERALNPAVIPKVSGKKQGAKVAAPKLDHLNVLHVAAIAIGKLKLKPDMIDGLMTPVQPLLLDVVMPDAQRLKYAEQFARQRRIDMQAYNAILSGVVFPPGSIAQFRSNPDTLLTVPEKDWPAPLRRAAALRAVMEEDNASQKAHIIGAALAGFSNLDLMGTLGDSVLADVEGIAPLPDNLPAAPAMARLLLLRGDKNAQGWWRLASAAPNSRETLLPLFPLALLRGVIGEDERTSWYEAYGRTQLLSSDRKYFNLAVVKTLGVMLPSNQESQLAAQNVIPAVTDHDKRMDGLLGNLGNDTNDAALRALLALKAMRQDRLAEMLALALL